MLKITRADGTAEKQVLETMRSRSMEVDRKVTASVAQIVEEVRTGGDRALRDCTLRFDGQCPDCFEVEREQIIGSLASADPDFVSSLLKAMENISTFHRHQVQQSFVDTQTSGVIMGQRVRGLERVGLYVPGGTASYPSSVLMNCIPAKIAGVGEVVMVTPPRKDGTANPDILTAAAVAGVDRVFLLGGAQAVAALAYGTETIPRVDKIVGPGNIYVATAKKLLAADETANPVWLAADMMSQAEHDELASSILLTTSERIAQETLDELERQLPGLSRAQVIRRSLETYGAIILCRNEQEMIELANQIAPEHMEVATANPLEYIGRIDNVGSLFLGQYAPEPLGDYYAGPNHVLPTSGTARFFSPLGVDSFLKKSSFLYYTKEALAQARDDIVRIAEREQLTAHANSIQVRF